jgi:hypothetical protein
MNEAHPFAPLLTVVMLTSWCHYCSRRCAARDPDRRRRNSWGHDRRRQRIRWVVQDNGALKLLNELGGSFC